MAGLARAMKRHGLTTKPGLRLVNTVHSGDVDYYMFDISDSGKHYTIAKHDFWRGADRKHTAPTDLRPHLATVTANANEIASTMSALAAAHTEPSSPSTEPTPMPPPPAEDSKPEYVRVRDMQVGDMVNAVGSPGGKQREVLRLESGTPNWIVHYVFAGTAALRSSKHPAGTKFILRKRATP